MSGSAPKMTALAPETGPQPKSLCTRSQTSYSTPPVRLMSCETSLGPGCVDGCGSTKISGLSHQGSSPVNQEGCSPTSLTASFSHAQPPERQAPDVDDTNCVATRSSLSDVSVAADPTSS